MSTTTPGIREDRDPVFFDTAVSHDGRSGMQIEITGPASLSSPSGPPSQLQDMDQTTSTQHPDSTTDTLRTGQQPQVQTPQLIQDTPTEQPGSATQTPTSLPSSSISSATGIQVSLTSNPLSLEEASKFISSPTSGANVFFTGTTRDNFRGRTVTRLEYSAYTPLALRTMLKLCQQVQKTHNLERIFLVHRLGVVQVGEESIVIGVSSAHRKAAWTGGEELLELVKEKVEVWKREWFLDGEVVTGRDGAVGTNVDNTPIPDVPDAPPLQQTSSSRLETNTKLKKNVDDRSLMQRTTAERGEWRANADTDGRGNPVPASTTTSS